MYICVSVKDDGLNPPLSFFGIYIYILFNLHSSLPVCVPGVPGPTTVQRLCVYTLVYACLAWGHCINASWCVTPGPGVCVQRVESAGCPDG